MNDAERRPATSDPRRQPAPPPLAGGQAAAPVRRGVSLRWPVAAAALGRGGRLQRSRCHTGVRRDRLPHLAASACRPATLQPSPRPLPGPQPAQLPRPLTPRLTLTGAARLSQWAASQGEPQAL